MKLSHRIAAILLGSTALAGSAAAQVKPTAQSIGAVQQVGAQPITTSSDVAGASPGCPSTKGAYTTDGSLSWVPTCFGTYTAVGQSIPVFPVRGVAKDANGNPALGVWTDNLIQAHGDGAIASENNGQFINFDVVGGAYSEANPGNGKTNSVGQLIAVHQHPDAAGNRPPYTWGQNIDFRIGAGSGNVQSYVAEWDLNNASKNCFPGSGCLSAALFLNGVNGYTNTAWIYSGGGATNNISGTVITSGTAITWASGQQFLSGMHRITIGGVVYRVTFVDATHLTVTSAAPPTNASPVGFTATNDAVSKGFFLQGSNNVADDDYYTSTSAYSAFTAAGAHNVVVNAAGDSAGYALLSRQGQNTCFNSFANCLYYDGSLLGYQTPGNGRVFGIDALGGIQTGSGKVQATGTGVLTFGNVTRGTGLVVDSAGGPVANYVYIQPATAGFGPAIKAIGSDTNTPLNLYAQGASPIQMQSPVTVNGGLTVTGSTSLASLGLTGNETIGGTLGVTGAATLASLGVTGNETVGGASTVTGTLTAGNLTTPGIVTAGGGSSTFGTNSLGTNALILNAAAGGQKRFITRTAGVGRWEWGQDASAETGSNAGGNFYIQAHNDDGSFGPTVISADRVTGGLKIGAGITASALPTTGGTVKGTVCQDTTGALYVKTTSGACL
jgi:hypothetical protein